jgi:hypothetical protein
LRKPKTPREIPNSELFGSADVVELRTSWFTATLNWRGVESVR